MDADRKRKTAPRRVSYERRAAAPRDVDWQRWSRQVELRRRRVDPARLFNSSRAEHAMATYVSFHLEGLEVTEGEVKGALAIGRGRRPFRSRQSQRVRNHAAILGCLDADLRAGRPLRPANVVRWYTSISCGLSTTELGEVETAHLTEQVYRINSPELRVAAAVPEIARLHVHLLNEPLVPGFNGILARLLLRYHLGRCGLPLVLFPPDVPREILNSERTFLPLLMELLDASYDAME